MQKNHVKINRAITLSVVSPVYCCGGSLEELCRRLRSVLDSLVDNYEIILVDDGSPDQAWRVIESLAKGDSRIKGVKLSRNFGQHCAISAGFDYAAGDWVVVMDCDLQDRPEEIPRLYNFARQGYDSVVGRRAERKDALHRKLISWLFSRIFFFFTSIKYDSRLASFGVYSRKVVRNLRTMRESRSSLGLLVIWLGFSRLELDVEHARRPDGPSGYSISKMLRLGFDSIINYSDKALFFAIGFGFFSATVALVYVAWIFVSYFIWSTPVVGWRSLIASIYLAMGVIVAFIGVVGLYIGKIFNEVKRRPLYVIDGTTFDSSGTIEKSGDQFNA